MKLSMATMAVVLLVASMRVFTCRDSPADMVTVRATIAVLVGG